MEGMLFYMLIFSILGSNIFISRFSDFITIELNFVNRSGKAKKKNKTLDRQIRILI